MISLAVWTEDHWAEEFAKSLERNTGVKLDLRYLGVLRDEGVQLAMITNNVREWEASWRAMLPETDELFTTVVNSCEVGVAKPDRRIFDLTAERVAVPAGAA